MGGSRSQNTMHDPCLRRKLVLEESALLRQSREVLLAAPEGKVRPTQSHISPISHVHTSAALEELLLEAQELLGEAGLPHH